MFDAQLEQFLLDVREQNAESTERVYRAGLGGFRRWMREQGANSLADITPVLVTRYDEYRQAAGKSARTRYTFRVHLNAFVKHLERITDGDFRALPILDLPMPKVSAKTTTANPSKAADAELVSRLLGRLDGDAKLVAQMQWMCGITLSSALQLRTEDIRNCDLVLLAVEAHGHTSDERMSLYRDNPSELRIHARGRVVWKPVSAQFGYWLHNQRQEAGRSFTAIKRTTFRYQVSTALRDEATSDMSPSTVFREGFRAHLEQRSADPRAVKFLLNSAPWADASPLLGKLVRDALMLAPKPQEPESSNARRS